MTVIKNILIVEADEIIRNGLKTLLEQHKYGVREANSIKACRENYDMDTREILVELGKRRMVGGQEDMIIDVALDLKRAKGE